MNRRLYQNMRSVSRVCAAITLASLTFSGLSLAAPPSSHAPHPTIVVPAFGGKKLVSKSTTMTPQEAARFRARMNAIPHLSRLSGRTQVHAFVAYFAAKGFRSTVYTAKYSPSGRIESLEYHATRGSQSTNKVDVSISKHRSSTAISMT